MNVLFVASESVPFVKTGGLADVIGSLPQELKKLGADVRVVLPKYSEIPAAFQEKMTYINRASITIIDHVHEFNVWELRQRGVIFYFIENAYLFERNFIYGHWDDAERFIFFSRAALMIPQLAGFYPDVIHTHDWHTALVNLYLKEHYQRRGHLVNTKSVFTIHNLKYQGIFDKKVFFEMMDLPERLFRADVMEYFDAVNFMKAGINYADLVTTVSETYAQEIQTPELGEGLDKLLHACRNKLRGIVNGIDYEFYSPRYDKLITNNYTSDTFRKQKQKNKTALRSLLGLAAPLRAYMGNVPLVAVISRLNESKGFELLLNIMDELLSKESMQLVILGTGDQYLVDRLNVLARRYQNKLAVKITFDETLAHQIYAAADIFAMPSRYEPCGLSQMIAMRYGALPVVRETGGLKDTVRPYNQYTQEGTGFSFANYTDWDLLAAMKRALDVYAHDHLTWDILVNNAMNTDYSWSNSAKKYLNLYQEI